MFQKINNVWIFVAQDSENGNEQLLMDHVTDGIYYPMVAHEERGMDRFYKTARRLGKEHDYNVLLVEFKSRIEIAQIYTAR